MSDKIVEGHPLYQALHKIYQKNKKPRTITHTTGVYTVIDGGREFILKSERAGGLDIYYDTTAISRD